MSRLIQQKDNQSWPSQHALPGHCQQRWPHRRPTCLPTVRPNPLHHRNPHTTGGICRRDSSEPAQMWTALSDLGLPQTGAVGVTLTGAGTGTQRCETGRAVAGPSWRGTAQRSPQAEREDRKPGQGPRQPERAHCCLGMTRLFRKWVPGARSVAVHKSQCGWGANRLAPPSTPGRQIQTCAQQRAGRAGEAVGRPLSVPGCSERRTKGSEGLPSWSTASGQRERYERRP